ATCSKPTPKPAASATVKPSPTPAQLPPVTDAFALRAVLEKARAEAGLPALAGALVYPDREIIAAVGTREINRKDAVTIDDPWHIGSDTKAMTAAVYAKLVEAGKAKWGATLPELFPKLTLDPAWKATTIEQAMAHRAGLTDIDAPWIIARRMDKR